MRIRLLIKRKAINIFIIKMKVLFEEVVIKKVNLT